MLKQKIQEMKELPRKGLEKYVESDMEREINPSIGNKFKNVGYLVRAFITCSGFHGYNIDANKRVEEKQKIFDKAFEALLVKGYSPEQIRRRTV